MWWSSVAFGFVLSAEVERVSQQVSALSPEACVPTLEQAFRDLEHLSPAEVDAADLEANGPSIVERVFAARLALHERLGAFVAAGTLTDDCMRSVRRADLAGRYLEDYVLGALPEEARPSDWLVNPAFSFRGRRDLRSGDVLVTRANALSSAGIAHMGRVDSQFSHNVLVYVDPADRVWGIMAYLEQGTLVMPMDEFLASGVDRVVVLRHPDPALAARAGSAAWERVVHGPPIDYDADFDYQDHTSLFCSEVPRWAFGSLIGQPETIPIPQALSVFDRERNAAMFEAMGVAASLTSAPSDALYDPTFAIVAEWRNPDDLVLLRRYDAVVESAMTWMEELQYRIEVQKRHRRLVEAALLMRRTPLVGRALRKRIHPRGDLAFLVTSLALQDAVTGVKDDLYAALAGRPEPIPYDELRAVLEQVRVDDLERWRADPESAHFTGLLHPAD